MNNDEINNGGSSPRFPTLLDEETKKDEGDKSQEQHEEDDGV